MSYQRERDQFYREVGHTLSEYQTTRLLRYASTLQRLAVAQCNGDYPCGNGERKVIPCPLCESQWVPSQITGGKLAITAWEHGRHQPPCDEHGTARKACPDCRTEAAVNLLLIGSSYQAITSGDPRGYVLKLYDTNATPTNIDNGTARSIGVPTRER